MEKRLRERERLKTLPYMPNFQKSLGKILASLKEAFQTFMNGPKMWNAGISYKFVTENVEQYRETGEREGEAQNTTFLDVSFRVSSVPDFLHDGSRQFQIISFVEEVNAGFCG